MVAEIKTHFVEHLLADSGFSNWAERFEYGPIASQLCIYLLHSLFVRRFVAIVVSGTALVTAESFVRSACEYTSTMQTIFSINIFHSADTTVNIHFFSIGNEIIRLLIGYIRVKID